MRAVPDNHRVEISVGHGRRDNRPSNVSLTVAELEWLLTLPPVRLLEVTPERLREVKNAMPYFIGGASTLGPGKSGGWRSSVNYPERSLAVLDADEVPPAALASLASDDGLFSEYRGCGYSTIGATPENPKLRLVLVLDEKLGREDFKTVTNHLIDRAEQAFPGLKIDRASSVNCQPMYIAPCVKDGKPFAFTRPGGFVEVGPILDSAARETAARVRAEKEYAAKGASRAESNGNIINARAKEVLEACGAVLTPTSNGEFVTNDPWNPPDKHPSLVLLKSGCLYSRPSGRGYSAIDYAMQSLGTDFKGAMEFLEERLGIPPWSPVAAPGSTQLDDRAQGGSLAHEEVPRDQFVYLAETNAYVYLPTGAQWKAAAVDAVSPGEVVQGPGKKDRYVRASQLIKETSSVTSRTSDPDHPQIIEGANFCEGGLVASPGARTLNTYRRAKPPPGDAALATPFVEHCKRVFNKPGDADQFFNYMAHRAQRPGEKPRFALLIAGPQGTGKDTAIDMCIPAIGAWNVASVSPAAFDAAFNEYQASTVVRINEASNLADMSKWALNEATKVLIAGAPDIATINPKYGKKFTVRMHCGVIVTTNNLSTGFYVPPDDRRYDVIDCATLEEMGLADAGVRRAYFEDLWNWFNFGGGDGHVAAFLMQRDISGFSASNGQRKTAAHREVIMVGLAQDEWFEEFLDQSGNPEVFLGYWATDFAAGRYPGRDFSSRLGAAAGRAGFAPYRNPQAGTGRWRIEGVGLATVYIRGTQPAGFHPPTDQRLTRRRPITPDHTVLKDVSSVSS